MRLSYSGLKEKEQWEQAGITLPGYDPEQIAALTKRHPVWVHFGIGNIFRMFIGGIADQLIEKGLMKQGITCVESFDFDVVDKIYDPFDNLVLEVTLHEDGRVDRKVHGALGEAVKAQLSVKEQRERLKQIFTDPGLQVVSFTITEKGYALRGADGSWLPYVKKDMENGPEAPTGAMGIVATLLYERFLAGKFPLALVSMDNVSRNGEKLRASVLETAETWLQNGFVEEAFVEYVRDEEKISFPWTMIDKITPRPGDAVAADLTALGVEDMAPVITSKKTYIAPFVNAEAPQYLVVEDSFPAGRPAWEKAGVYMTDRVTVNLSERMKVTACLNPLHTALCVYDCMLGYELFADGMKDPDLAELARQVGYVEGLPVVENPGILSPEKFLEEVIQVRFPNPYLGDTSQRIAVDISQMVGIRFGETIKAHVEKKGSAGELKAIPLAIAGWLRYLLAVDDNLCPMELAPDPMIPELQEKLQGIVCGEPETFTDQLKNILSNRNIFGTDLYAAGIGEKIEEMFREQLAGAGAVRETLHRWLFTAER